jgi:protein-L-isoaspartate(D-aspartate) O-methyltransferase
MALAISGIGMTSNRTRQRMIDRLREKGINNEKVLSAMLSVPRHVFVEEALASRAYEDTALPLGFSQTISQPFIVARMISILLEGRTSLGKTLEIGTGCGYQAAVLSPLASEVFTVERIEPLLERAQHTLSQLELDNVRCRYADGSLGIPAAAPFDSIIAAAAPSSVPPALMQQLRIGGRLVLPVGSGQDQTLLFIERRIDKFVETRLDPVRFVPLLPGTE